MQVYILNGNKLILIDDKDKTEEIISIDLSNNYYQICFINSTKIYSYSASRIKIYSLIKKLNPQEYCIQFYTHQHAPIKYILDYGSLHKVFFKIIQINFIFLPKLQ